MKLFLKLILLIVFCWIQPSLAKHSAWHFKSSDVNALHSAAADQQIAYGKDPLQFAELRLPHKPGPYPVVIIIHGGCWVSKFADLHNTAALADALRASGYATWNVEYRREDNAGGGWPGTFTDVAQAADFLPTIADKYSLDLNRVIVIGHSAGGQLALWLAARHRLPTSGPLYSAKPLAVRGVVTLGGVTDMKAFREYNNSRRICDSSDVIGNLLGQTEEKITERYRSVSPIELLPFNVPQILIYGKDDKIVPATFGKTYQQVAQSKGDKVKIVEVPYAAHHELIVPNSVSWPVLHSAIKSLIKNQLSPDKNP
ncbi:MAG: alpha/beta hydrolase [Gammaproteobacteria bacterium]